MPKDLLNATDIVYYSNGIVSGVLEYVNVPGVLVDGKDTTDYTAGISQSVISFKIPIEAGRHEIEIAGISIPEFNGTILAVLSSSVVGAMMLTAKYRHKWII